MQETRPILIIGAGPTGMTAALELSRMGVPVRLVDKALEPSTTSRALAVQARTLELMAQRGLADTMLAVGNRGHAATIYNKGKILGHVELNQIESPFNFVLLIPQSETERILREQLQQQSVKVEFGTEMTAFSRLGDRGQDTGIRATLRKQDGSLEDLEAAYLIAAEGAHSLVRNTLGLAFKGKSLPHTYALADLHLDGKIAEDELSIFLPNKGLMAVFPIGHQRYRMIATDTDETQQQSKEPTIEHMQDLWNQSSHIPAKLYDMYWSSQFRINSRMLDHLQQGRIFFGGDSAHIHSPAGGQGMNTGIQDMINLGWKLALVYNNQASPALLDTYEAERLPIIRSLVETTEGATDAFTADSPFLHSLISLIGPAALHLEIAQKRAAKILSQTGNSYSDGPLTHGSGNVNGNRAGDRILQLTDANNPHQQWWNPSRFTLWTTESQAAGIIGKIAHSKDLIDIRTDLAEVKNRSHAESLLIRPDGHVALIAREQNELFSWLEKWAIGANVNPQQRSAEASS